MSHIGDWFNYQASLKILVFAMLAGAALGAVRPRDPAAVRGAGDISLDGASNGSARDATRC